MPNSNKSCTTNFKNLLSFLNPHNHLCLIYESEAEWKNTVIPFMLIGLERGEKCIYIIDAGSTTAGQLREVFEESGLNVAEAEKEGHLVIMCESDTYTRGGIFDPHSAIQLLISETEKALNQGYSALRVTGEMNWTQRGCAGSDKLLQYEAAVNRDLFHEYPCIALCQYNRWESNPETIKGVLQTHPLLVKSEQLFQNPYYIEPEEYLSGKKSERELQSWLNTLEEKRQLQEALSHNEHRLRLLAENAQDLIYRYEIRPKRRFSYVNPAATFLTGYSPAEHYSDPELYFKIVHPGDRHLIEAVFGDKYSLEQSIGQSLVHYQEQSQEQFLAQCMDPPRGKYIEQSQGQFLGQSLEGQSREQLQGQLQGPSLTQSREQLQGQPLGQPIEPLALRFLRRDGEAIWLEKRNVPIYDEAGNLIAIEGIARDITKLKRMEETLHRRLKALEAVYKVSAKLRSAEALEDMLPILLDETLAVFNTEAGAIKLYYPASGELRFAAARGWFAELEENPLSPKEGIAGTVFASGQAHITREFASDPLIKHPEKVPKNWGGACFPIRAADEVIGVFYISVSLPREMTKEELNLLASLAEMAGTAVHRISLHEETTRRLRRLQSLRAVDQAISASMDLRLMLDVLLEHVITQMEADAATIFLFQPDLKTLKFAAGRGSQAAFLERTSLRLGETAIGKAALERRTICVTGLAEEAEEVCASLLKGECFDACMCVPLITKGELKGVIAVFYREPFTRNADTESLDFLEMLAGQAAIAIDNTRLFDNLQQANLELFLAYDATIEGWARALELRDRETEGHTRRVKEMTMKLAQLMGIPEDKLIHVYRGALLHDIGKMGVPDAILLKSGKLTEEEWEIMRQHPQFAYDMLSPIDYLHPALNIPYCHHEKWDGSGYPRGLKGEEIPLEARIFAVADVYDALTSDRPYRPAWSRKEALQYIREQSGKHFDPRVVELFLKEIAG